MGIMAAIDLRVTFTCYFVTYVMYLSVGSALKDSDLQRCRMSHAEGCFILASRHHQDRTAAVSYIITIEHEKQSCNIIYIYMCINIMI